MKKKREKRDYWTKQKKKKREGRESEKTSSCSYKYKTFAAPLFHSPISNTLMGWAQL